MKRVKESISTITSAFVWLNVLILLTCILGAYINPTKVPIFGLASLMIAPMVGVNMLLLIFTIINKKRTGIGVFIALLLSVPQIQNVWAFNIRQNKTQLSSENELKILTYNVRNFDLYSWSHNLESKELIFNTIKELKPDIICFQEFYSRPGEKWDNIKRLKEDYGYNYYYFTRELVSEKGSQWGIATFSKYPIVNHGELLPETRKNKPTKTFNKGIFTDIATNLDTVRIINTHLASIYFNTEDYSTIDNIVEPEGISLEKSKPIISKLMSGYKRRGLQVKLLNQFITKENQPHPIIICGDFNDAPTSYAYNKLSKNFQDSFLKTGWGLGGTYNGFIAGLRIDFTLVDKSFTVQSSQQINLNISDHFPFLTTISSRKE